MNLIHRTFSLACIFAMAACSGGGRQPEPSSHDHAYQGLSGRLNQSQGYMVDEEGNWVPRNDKRSQYESRGDAAYFSGNVSKKNFSTNRLQKGSWMGGKEVAMPNYRHSGSKSSIGGASTMSKQDAVLDRQLRTPERIVGNHITRATAHETHGTRADKPEDAAVNSRRKVYVEPDIIDYRQQRELSIQQSKQLLGRDKE